MKFDKIKELKGAGIYASAEIIYKGLNWTLLLLLFFLSKENPEDYGLLAVLVAFERITGVVVDFGQKRVIYRFYDNYSSNNKRFLSSTLIAWLLMTVLCLGLFYVILLLCGQDTFFMIPIRGSFFLELCNLTLLNIVSFTYCLLRISKNVKKYAMLMMIISLSRFFVTISLSLFGYSVYNSYIWGFFIALCIGIIECRTVLTEVGLIFAIDFNIIKRNFLYGYPLILQQAISNLGPNIDKFFLTNYVSLEYIGYYNFIITLTSAFSFFYSIETSFFEPAIFRSKNDENKILNINNSFLHSSTWFSTIVIIVTSIVLVTIRYSQVNVYIIIAVAYSFLPLYFYNTYIYMVHDKNMDVVKWSSVAVLTVFVADYFLIARYGIIGAAYAQLIYTYILSWLSYAYMTYKYPEQKYKINKYMGISIAVLLAVSLFTSTFYLICVCIPMLIFSSYFIIKNKSIVFNSLKI